MAEMVRPSTSDVMRYAVVAEFGHYPIRNVLDRNSKTVRKKDVASLVRYCLFKHLIIRLHSSILCESLLHATLRSVRC
jgi:hypothetical protein